MMKLTTHLSDSYILLLICFITCSHAIAPSGFLCRELKLAKFSTFSANSSGDTPIILGFLHADNEDFYLELSWKLPTAGCQASIVSVVSGSLVWNSSISLCSTLVLYLDQNGSLAVIKDGHSVLWRSHSTRGIQVWSLELLEDGEQLLWKNTNCKALQQRSATARRIIKDNPTRAILLQNSSINAATNPNVSFKLTSESNVSPSNSIMDDKGGHRNKKALAMEIAFPVVGFFLLLGLCIAIAFYRKKRGKGSSIDKKDTAYSNSVQKISRTREQEDEVLLETLAPGLPPRFTYAEMLDATNGFTKKLGEGGYGAVFEGTLQKTGTKIAVKVFLDTQSFACRNGFCKEVMSIGEVKHQNLVQLRGFCVEDEHRMLVYELMENGSLHKLLFGVKASEKSKLQWERRRAIAIDTARALAFLHEEGEQKRAVIHCDVKPENILLNENWVAKVSDFGLAKLLWGSSANKHHEDDDHGESDGRQPSSAHDGSSTWETGCLSGLISSKGVRGTLGYLAPEWVRVEAGPDTITTACDVYSFGVVLLELIAGRRPMVPGQPFLLGHAFDTLANGGDLSSLLDPCLFQDVLAGTSQKYSEDAQNVVKLALWCLQEDITLRPTMTNIVTMLTTNQSLPSPPFCEYFAGSSHFFDEVSSQFEEPIFSSNTSNSHDKDLDTSTTMSYDQGSWQISILSAR